MKARVTHINKNFHIIKQKLHVLRNLMTNAGDNTNSSQNSLKFLAWFVFEMLEKELYGITMHPFRCRNQNALLTN